MCRGVARNFRGYDTLHIPVGTIIATNVKSLNGGCGTAKSVAALTHVPHHGYASDHVAKLVDVYLYSLHF